MCRRLLMMILCLSPWYAWAQWRNDTIAEVTVTGERPAADVLSAIPLRQMDREQMAALGLTTLADAVRRLAGADVKDYGGIGGLKTVSVRHLGAHHTAVSYDGVPISNTQGGQIDIGRYALDNVRQVSLAVGQNNDIMQPARLLAAAGVLAISTEQPALSDKPWKLQATIRGGSFGLLNTGVRYWQQMAPRTLLALDGTFMRANGNYPFTLVNGRMKTREHRRNSEILSRKAEANIFHTFCDSSTLQAKAYYYRSQRELPGVVILYNSDTEERLWDENLFLQARYTRRLARHWQLHARLKYDHGWNRYEDINVKYAGGKQTDVARQNEYYASATIGWQPTSAVAVALAQDVFINRLHNNIETQPNPQRYTALTALTARWTAARWQANAHLTATIVNNHVTDEFSAQNYRRLSPALSCSYRLLPGESLFLRLLVKHTFRVPSFNDMYYLHIGNRNLMPEKAREHNLGLTWSHRFGKGVAINLTADGYFNHVSDKIVAFPTTYVWRMTNFGKVHIAGLEATLAATVAFTKLWRADLTAAYTLQRAIDKTDPNRSSWNDQLPYTPRHSGNATATLHTPWLTIGYAMNACGQRWSMGQNTDEYRLAPYCEHTLTLSRTLQLRKVSISLAATLQNLTDEQYEIIKYYPMPGRSWQLSATVVL